jgi:hypothetical protein
MQKYGPWDSGTLEYSVEALLLMSTMLVQRWIIWVVEEIWSKTKDLYHCPRLLNLLLPEEREREELRAHLDLLANLTLDDPSDQCIPKVIDSLKGIPIVGASAGHRHSILLDKLGGVYTCGSGVTGALGHGDALSHMYPMKVMEFGTSCAYTLIFFRRSQS